MSIVIYSISEVAHLMNVTERWLREQLRTNRFPGRKISRHWCMTDEDIQDALALCANDFRHLERDSAPVVGLTPRSRKRVSG